MRLIQLIRSIAFIITMYLVMILYTLVGGFMTLFNREYAYLTVRKYCQFNRVLAHYMVGLKSEIRGDVPDGEVLVCSKHQSFFDIILLVSVLPRPKFIMKKQILYTPIVGFFAKRMNCIAVDRGKRGAAIKKMVADFREGRAEPSQLVIFSQGTRVAAGAKRPYKIGSGVLYNETGQTCVPTATNVGVFWKRTGLMREPGLAVLEFLPPIEPGLEMSDFMEKLENEVETASDALMREVGFDPDSYAGD